MAILIYNVQCFNRSTVVTVYTCIVQCIEVIEIKVSFQIFRNTYRTEEKLRVGYECSINIEKCLFIYKTLRSYIRIYT